LAGSLKRSRIFQEEKIVRRRIAIAPAAIALVVTAAMAIAACGGSGKSSSNSNNAASGAKKQNVTLTMWTMPNSPDPKGDLQKLLQPFTAQTGIKVKVQVVGWDVQLDRIRNAAVSGSGPDVTQAGTTQVPFFAALGGFSDIGSKVGQIGGASGYNPAVWNTTKLSGKNGTWALPWFTEARAIYYRKDVLKKAGLDPATAFKDWDTFRQSLLTIKQKVPSVGGKPIKPFGQPGSKAFDLVHDVMPFVWAAGGSELSSDDKTSTINSPQAMEGVKFMTQLIKDGTFDTSQLERDGTQVENQFKGGKLAVWIGGPWVLATVPRKDDDTWSAAARKNVGVAPLPAGPVGKAFTFLGGSDLMVFKSSKHQDAAWQLLKYMASDKVQTAYAQLLGMFPAKESAQAQFGEQDSNHKEFLDAVKDGRTYAPIAQWAEVENAYKGSFGQILADAASHGGNVSDATLKSQLDKAAKQADGLLAQSTG
jgi:multiple sugar transport system substrate-binding protein